jgi:uncharacterized protein YjdB
MSDVRNDVVAIEIKPQGGTVTAGAGFQLTLFTRDARGGTGLVPANQATWSASDPRVAEVSRQGRVTPRRAGTVTITAGYAALVAHVVFTVVE